MNELMNFLQSLVADNRIDQPTKNQIHMRLNFMVEAYQALMGEISRVSHGLIIWQTIREQRAAGTITDEVYYQKLDLVFNNIVNHPVFLRMMPEIRQHLLSEGVDLDLVEDVTEHLPSISEFPKF